MVRYAICLECDDDSTLVIGTITISSYQKWEEVEKKLGLKYQKEEYLRSDYGYFTIDSGLPKGIEHILLIPVPDLSSPEALIEEVWGNTLDDEWYNSSM